MLRVTPARRRVRKGVPATRAIALAAGLTGLIWAGTGGVPASAAVGTVRGADGLVAYVAPTGALRTVDVTRKGSERTLVASRAFTPRFNPYGKRIAYADATGTLRSVPTAGGARTVLWAPGNTGDRALWPTWAPAGDGGQRLAFVLTPANGRGDIWVLRTDHGAGVGAPTRLTFAAGTSCAVSAPDWSPDGGRLAYVRTLPNADGTCRAKSSSQPLRVQFVVRDLARGTSSVLPPVPATQGSQPAGPLRFTADGTALTVGLSYDADGSGCTATWLAYSFATRDYHGVARGDQCDFGTMVDEVVPTPAGQIAAVYDDFTLDDSGGYTTWTLQVTTPSGVYSAPQVREDAQPWSGIDVQPRPAN